MGRGDRFMQKSFSVPMPGGDSWPFESEPESKSRQRRAEAHGLACGECGKAVLPGSPHTDARDEGRPRKRVCFGKVVVR